MIASYAHDALPVAHATSEMVAHAPRLGSGKLALSWASAERIKTKGLSPDVLQFVFVLQFELSCVFLRGTG